MLLILPSKNRAARVITGISYEDADHHGILKDVNILNVRRLVELDTTSLMYLVENDLLPADDKIYLRSMVRSLHTTLGWRMLKKTKFRLVPKYGKNCWSSSEGFSQLNFFKKK